MALKPENPVVGGTVLRRAAIQSPNYVPGVSGWTINQDGSVEFNNGLFRGTVTAATFVGTDFIINAAGAFFYSGAPAAGNLIASDASIAGVEGFGNNYVAGQASYAATTATALTAGQITFYTGSLAGGWGVSATQRFFSGLILLSGGLETQNNVLDDGSGNCSVLGTMTVQGTSLSVGNGATANLLLAPKMAAPPNAAAVGAGTATLAQLEAFCNGLYTSMRNRGMFN